MGISDTIKGWFGGSKDSAAPRSEDAGRTRDAGQSGRSTNASGQSPGFDQGQGFDQGHGFDQSSGMDKRTGMDQGMSQGSGPQSGSSDMGRDFGSGARPMGSGPSTDAPRTSKMDDVIDSAGRKADDMTGGKTAGMVDKGTEAAKHAADKLGEKTDP